MANICINEHGQSADVRGGEVIRICLEYYLELEWYDRRAYLRDLQTGFTTKHERFKIDI